MLKREVMSDLHRYMSLSVFPLGSEGKGRVQTQTAHHRPEPDGRAHPAGPGEEAQPRVPETLHLRG